MLKLTVIVVQIKSNFVQYTVKITNIKITNIKIKIKIKMLQYIYEDQVM